jgi:hypothetical protein
MPLQALVAEEHGDDEPLSAAAHGRRPRLVVRLTTTARQVQTPGDRMSSVVNPKGRSQAN